MQDEKQELEKEEVKTEEQIQEEKETDEETSDPEEDIIKRNIELEKEVKELQLAYTRKLAEFQNFTKRKENEFTEMKKYASENIIVRLLEDIDNLERAVHASNETKNFDALKEGVEMILKNLKNLLKDEEVEEIKSEGVEFDPYEHQAIMTDNVEGEEDNKILDVFKKGYKLKGKVIRPSMVKINKK